MKDRILIVRKMSSLEYYYNGNHKSRVINESHKRHNESIEKIKKILVRAGKKFDIITRKELSEELVKNYDAVISAGGDGTVIAVAAYNKNTPQLNLKTDSKSVGALCQKDILKSLNAFLSGKYKIEKWQRQDIYLNGKFIGRACNETCIGEKLRFDQLAKYKLTFLDARRGFTKKEIQSASGMIVATGTGSSAWPNVFKRYPRNSPYLKFKTLLLHSGTIKEGKATYIKIDYKGHEGKFSIDTKEYGLPRDSQLKIKLSKNPLRVIS